MDNNLKVEETEVCINISDDVIVGISINAIKDINEVASVANKFTGNDIKDILVKKTVAKGVKIDRLPEGINLSLFVNIVDGVVIPDVAKKVQQAVKASVESMTGLTVLQVTVNVVGISISKELKRDKE